MNSITTIYLHIDDLIEMANAARMNHMAVTMDLKIPKEIRKQHEILYEKTKDTLYSLEHCKHWRYNVIVDTEPSVSDDNYVF
jgi:hypothetical protein